jgi:hypothetical protein
MNLLKRGVLFCSLSAMSFCAPTPALAGGPGHAKPPVAAPAPTLPALNTDQAAICAEQGGCAYVTRQQVLDLLREATERAFEAGREQCRVRNGSAS